MNTEAYLNQLLENSTRVTVVDYKSSSLTESFDLRWGPEGGFVIYTCEFKNSDPRKNIVQVFLPTPNDWNKTFELLKIPLPGEQPVASSGK